MKPTDILIKPILSEKANAKQETLRQYAFKVARSANKLQIKNAIETFYGITVVNVNTMVVPGKIKHAIPKRALYRGKNRLIKKHWLP